MSDLKQLFSRAVNKLRDDSLEQGTLGVHRPDTTVDMAVTGRAGWLHVTLNGQTPVKAYNKANVPQTVDLQVDMRVVDGRRVIVGVSGKDNLSVPVPIPADGVWPHTLGSHSDVDITAGASGDVLAHDGTDWVDETPVTTSAGAGDAGKLVRTDAGGQIDVTMIAAEDIAAKIDGATVSSTMTTTDKIAAVISGTLRYFTYQTIRDAIKSYYDSVVATLTNKSIDASANTLTNIDTSALANDAVSNAKLANMAADTIKGRANGAGTGDPTDLTAAQVLTILTSVISAAFWTFTNKIAIAATATTGAALSVVRDLAAASTDSPVVSIVQDNASDDQPALRVQQDGSGAVIVGYDGATKVFELSDGGTLNVYTVIKALSASGISVQDDGGNEAMLIEDGGFVNVTSTNAAGSAVIRYTNDGGDSGGTSQIGVGGSANANAALADRLILYGRNASGVSVIATATAGGDIRFYSTLAAERACITSAGDFGIGTTAPQGLLHAVQGSGSFMFEVKAGIVGTKVVIIANGTGDVTQVLTGFFTLSDGTSGVANAISMIPTDTYAIAVGGSTWTLTLAANGEFSVQRTAGSGTATMTFMLTWI